MSEEFLTLREKLENHRRTDIDAYGATHEAEFFAVLTEHFFMDGPDLKTKHPEIYALFRDYFRLDPGNWGKRASNTPPTNGQPS